MKKVELAQKLKDPGEAYKSFVEPGIVMTQGHKFSVSNENVVNKTEQRRPDPKQLAALKL